MVQSLDETMSQAMTSNGLARIKFRDELATYGLAALAPMALWVQDATLGAFAVRVIERIGRRWTREAISALRGSIPANAIIRTDVVAAIGRLERGEFIITRDLVEAQRQIEGARRRLHNASSLEDRVEAMSLLIDLLRRLQDRPVMDSLERDRIATVARLVHEDGMRYQNHCWACHTPVDEAFNPHCPTCGWLTCLCGACRDPRHAKGTCPMERFLFRLAGMMT